MAHEREPRLDWLDAGTSKHSWGIYPALKAIRAAGKGVMILMHRTETGQDVLARALPELNQNAVQKWDLRTYGIGAQMLKRLGVGKMQLMSQPRKMPSMTGFGLEVTGFVQPE